MLPVRRMLRKLREPSETLSSGLYNVVTHTKLNLYTNPRIIIPAPVISVGVPLQHLHNMPGPLITHGASIASLWSKIEGLAPANNTGVAQNGFGEGSGRDLRREVVRGSPRASERKRTVA